MKKAAKRAKKRSKKNRVFSQAFKVDAVEQLMRGGSPTGVARILRVSRQNLYNWLDRYHEEGLKQLRGPGRPAGETEAVESIAESAERQIAELQRKVGRQELELDFLKRAFERVKELRQSNTGNGGSASTGKSGK